MTAFSFSSGDPTHLTSGANALMVDLSGPFADIKARLNSSGQFDSSDLATSVLAPYRQVPGGQSQWKFDNGNTLAKPWHWTGSAGVNGINTDGNDLYPPVFVSIDPTALAMTGRTTKLRLRGSIMANAQAFGAATVTFGLYSVTSVQGTGPANLAITLALSGWVTGGSVAVSVPGASAHAQWAGVDFDVPSAGDYVLGWQLSAAGGANSAIGGTMFLEYHHV